jgi:hypothetical protein
MIRLPKLPDAASGIPAETRRHDCDLSDLELDRSERLALNHACSGEQADVQPAPADRLKRPCQACQKAGLFFCGKRYSCKRTCGESLSMNRALSAAGRLTRR